MTDLILITPEKLSKLIAQSVEEALEKKLPIQQTNKEVPKKNLKLYNRKETAKMLRVSLPTLNAYVKKGIITGQRIGARILFKEQDVEEALTRINHSF